MCTFKQLSSDRKSVFTGFIKDLFIYVHLSNISISEYLDDSECQFFVVDLRGLKSRLGILLDESVVESV
jgi:hypothetical protein